ncbi:MAG: hypothetical protein IJ282_05745 [Lachnospiraceae bacterium]|nr:hypothetical protein [Lachnospiraceae bacterium]
MIQLWIVGIIIIFILGAMLLSRSQAMHRFAVMEFLLILAVIVVSGVCVTKTQAFMKEQYFALFRVYINDAQLYALDMEAGIVDDSEAAWQRTGNDLQAILEQCLPVTIVGEEEYSYLTAAIYERDGQEKYNLRTYRQAKEGYLTERECAKYIEKLAGKVVRYGDVCWEETSDKTAVLVYAGKGAISPAYILLTEIPLEPLNLSVMQMKKEVMIYGAAVLLVGTLLLATVVYLQGKQLRKLTRQVVRVAEGKEDWETLQTTGDGFWGESNDMRILKNSLAQISADVARMNYMRFKVLQGYYRFAPKQIEKILGKQSILEVGTNDRINITGTIAFVAYAEDKKSGEQEYLAKMRREQEMLSEKQKEHGGILISDNSDLTTMQLLFQEDTQKALQFGIEMVAKRDNRREQNFVLLHSTSFVYGVAGNEEQAFTYVISKEMKMLEKYVERFRAAGIRMAVTDGVYEMIEKYTTGRYIGYLEEEGCTFKIYEILDACPAAERQRRIETSAKFEKALNLFYQGDYYLGRTLFTEVLKVCPDDEVAKGYLFLCERCLNAEHGKDISCALFSD